MPENASGEQLVIRIECIYGLEVQFALRQLHIFIGFPFSANTQFGASSKQLSSIQLTFLKKALAPILICHSFQYSEFEKKVWSLGRTEDNCKGHPVTQVYYDT